MAQAFLHTMLLGLELSGWSLQLLRNSPQLPLLCDAIKETTAIAAQVYAARYAGFLHAYWRVLHHAAPLPLRC
jgi:hypothetical protein